MMKSLACVLLLVHLSVLVTGTNTDLDAVWKDFMKVHNKTYINAPNSEEHKLRRLIFEEHVDIIRKHNLRYDLGLVTFSMGINEYADLSFEEYRHYLLGARPEHSTSTYSSYLTQPKFNPENDPAEVDWRTKGYVTPIKNQGRCGSCWAFSSTGALEGQHFRETGRLVSLSEQQLVDCCSLAGGCGGGWMDNAFKCVEMHGGIDTETYYPYQAKEMGRCTFNPNDVGSKCTGFVDIKPRGDETALRSACANVGPIAVAIDAAHQSFQLYKTGVYVEPACSNKTSDHAVLVVGYGTTEDGQDYWLVKNSWGVSWGDEGYIKMARNKGNQCAIARFATYPDVPVDQLRRLNRL